MKKLIITLLLIIAYVGTYSQSGNLKVNKLTAKDSIKGKTVTITGEYTLPLGDSTSGYLVKTDGSGQWTYVSPSGVGQDSMYVSYCSGCTGISGWKLTGDTIFIDTLEIIQRTNGRINPVNVSDTLDFQYVQAQSYVQSTGMDITKRFTHTGRAQNYISSGEGVSQGAGVINTLSYLKQTGIAHGQGNSAFFGGCFDGENIWICPYSSDSLIKINPATNKLSKYYFNYPNQSFDGMIYDGRYIWLTPRSYDSIVRLNPFDMSFVAYKHGQGSDDVFAGGAFDGRYIWLIPRKSDSIVRIDPNNASMVKYAHAGVASIEAFASGCFDGENIWMVSRYCDSLLKMNVTTHTITYIAHNQGNGAFYGAVFDGQNIWCVPYDSDSIVKINPKTDDITTYPHGQGVDGAFVGGVFDGQSIWLIPRVSDSILKVNPENGTHIAYAHNEPLSDYLGAVFDGDNIWMIPFSADSIVKFRPQEFGEESIFTSGTLSVGEEVYMPNLTDTIGIAANTKVLITTGGSGEIKRIDADSLINSTVSDYAWSLTGNTGTNPATNWCGTFDKVPFSLYSNYDGGSATSIILDTNNIIKFAGNLHVPDNIYLNGASPLIKFLNGAEWKEEAIGFNGFNANRSIDIDSAYAYYIHKKKVLSMDDDNTIVVGNATNDSTVINGVVKSKGDFIADANAYVSTNLGVGTTTSSLYRANIRGNKTTYPLLYVSNDGDATIDSTCYVDFDGSIKTSSYSLTNIGASVGKLTNPTTKLDVFGNATTGGLLHIYNDKDLTYDSSVYVNKLGFLGLGTITPTNRLSFGNTSAHKMWIENSATDVVGRDMTIAAGGTILGTAVDNVFGGNLIFQSGLGTGTGASKIIFNTGRTLTTGKILQTLTQAMEIDGNGTVQIGGVGVGRYSSFANTGLLTINYNDNSGEAFMLTFSNIYGNTTNYRSILFQSGDGVTKYSSAKIQQGHEENWTSTSTTRDAFIAFYTSLNGSLGEKVRINSAGNIGAGITVPTAVLHLKAPTATASTGQIKLDVGTAPTVAEGGGVNHVGTTTNSTFQVTNYVNSVATVNTVAGVITKTDTGDPATAFEGQICINTFDNTLKMYAEGAWRAIATTW